MFRAGRRVLGAAKRVKNFESVRNNFLQSHGSSNTGEGVRNIHTGKSAPNDYHRVETSVSTNPPVEHNYMNYVQSRRPTFWKRLTDPGCAERFKASKDTLDTINTSRYPRMRRLADENLARWKQEAQEFPKPNIVEVSDSEWGSLLAKHTEKNGKPYSVLVNGSADYPGGDFPYGSAQEEDLWTRTDASKVIMDTFESIYYSEDEQAYRYKPDLKSLLKAIPEMNSAELKLLSSIVGKPAESAHKVQFVPKPLLYFRDASLRMEADPREYPEVYKTGYITDHHYPLLSDDKLLPFYVVNAAATRLSDGQLGRWHDNLPPIDADWQNPEFVNAFKKDARRRVGGILDTLIINRQRNAIFSAFGCGVYANDPHVVAQVFREELERRPGCFDHIAFSAPKGLGFEKINYEAFHSELDGMELNNPQPGQKPQSFFFHKPKGKDDATTGVRDSNGLAKACG